MNGHLPVVLASGSVFRQAQLRRLGLAFEAVSSDCDETPLAGELPQQTALRLAQAKARALADRFDRHLLIGADQVAFCDGRQLGKPMTLPAAEAMLAQLSGRRVVFYSAVCLLNTVSGSLHSHVDETVVQMRSLSGEQIRHYLAREPDAVYCAGAAKSEGLGAALLARIDSSDPNALIGLPLFKLLDFLVAEGVSVL